MISNPIIAPRAGDQMRASWGAAVAERANECADAIDALRGPGGLVSFREPSATVLAPFACRYHEVEDGGAQWEIYLPDGCVNVGGTCAPINPAAKDSEGHEDDSTGWHSFDLDESAGTTGTDADGNSYREWNVAIHAKTSAKMWQVDDLNAPARRLVWASAVDRLKTTFTDAERYKDTPGDSFSCVVARIRVTEEDVDGETVTHRTVTPQRRTAVDVGDVPAPTGFDLVWYFSVADGALAVEKVYCLRQLASVAGMSVTGDQMTEVTDATWITARIDTADMSSGEGLISVVTEQASDEPDTLITWLALYKMVENTVTGDYRIHSLGNVQLYRA